jgi:hypothetical protein
MVLGSQDKWRKHPLLAGGWKKPLPGLGMAAGIFALYLAVDYTAGIAFGTSPLITYKYGPSVLYTRH